MYAHMWHLATSSSCFSITLFSEVLYKIDVALVNFFKYPLDQSGFSCGSSRSTSATQCWTCCMDMTGFNGIVLANFIYWYCTLFSAILVWDFFFQCRFLTNVNNGKEQRNTQFYHKELIFAEEKREECIRKPCIFWTLAILALYGRPHSFFILCFVLLSHNIFQKFLLIVFLLATLNLRESCD